MSSRPYTSTPAANVKPGDVVIFDTPRWDVTIERVFNAQTDGWIKLTGNSETWTLFLKNTDTVRVLQA